MYAKSHYNYCLQNSQQNDKILLQMCLFLGKIFHIVFNKLITSYRILFILLTHFENLEAI